MKTFIKRFSEISISDIATVGGKNASLGELFSQLTPKGILVPDGFAITADAYRFFCEENCLIQPLNKLLATLDTETFDNLDSIGTQARLLIKQAPIPHALAELILQAYNDLSEREHKKTPVAVRSSATAEDLPSASFAGQLESFLNVEGEENIIQAVHHCYTSLFTNRAIKYRVDMGFGNKDLAVSVGVQTMVRADTASSGVAFTLDPDTGFDKVIIINSIFGLGENIVQ